MPQSINGNWKFKDIPYGKGSRSGDTLDAAFRHRRRAAKINEAEKYRCGLTTHMMEKHHKAVEHRHGKVMARLRKSLEEISAYKKVLESYRASKFQTMQWGFREKHVNTPRTFQRHKLERRVYYCGFSVDTLKPEVMQVIAENRPEVRRDVAHRSILAVARERSDFLINRKQTNEELFSVRKRDILKLVSREKSTVEVTKRLFANH